MKLIGLLVIAVAALSVIANAIVLIFIHSPLWPANVIAMAFCAGLLAWNIRLFIKNKRMGLFR